MVRTKVFVGNLSFKTKEAQLAAEFSPAGKVISANIITRGPRSLGYGFVELDSEEDAQNAVTVMNKKEIDGRAINVEIAKPQDETKERQPRPVRPEGGENDRRKLRRPRRKNIPKKDEEEGVEGEGEGRPTNNEGKKEESEKNDRFPRKPRIRSRYRYRTGESGERRVSNEEKEESKTTLFVANLPFSLDDDGFGKIVSELNLKLKSAHVVKKRNGRSKGYGFIEFDTQEEQQKALTALNKKIVDSRELSVKIALTEIHDKEEGEKKSVPEKKEKEEKKVTPEKKTATPEKKPATPEKEEKKVTPEKKTATPEKKAATSEKEEKKVTPEKKTATPEKKAATSEKE